LPEIRSTLSVTIKSFLQTSSDIQRRYASKKTHEAVKSRPTTWGSERPGSRQLNGM
ncbi:hypothetical protein HDU93_002822, partial [Gonapodya sp. JEL0774]